jgi:hypothetical protein
MKTRVCLALIAAIAIVATGVGIGAQEEKEKKEAPVIKCPVSGKPINKEISVAYKEAKVYFCCPGCPAPFEKDTAKFAAKANHQLVATKQFKQKACPISGRDCKPEHATTVAAVKVFYCCPNCKGKVEKANEAEQLTLVFVDAAFKKGFEKVKEEEKKAATDAG